MTAALSAAGGGPSICRCDSPPGHALDPHHPQPERSSRRRASRQPSPHRAGRQGGPACRRASQCCSKCGNQRQDQRVVPRVNQQALRRVVRGGHQDGAVSGQAPYQAGKQHRVPGVMRVQLVEEQQPHVAQQRVDGPACRPGRASLPSDLCSWRAGVVGVQPPHAPGWKLSQQRVDQHTLLHPTGPVTYNPSDQRWRVYGRLRGSSSRAPSTASRSATASCSGSSTDPSAATAASKPARRPGT